MKKLNIKKVLILILIIVVLLITGTLIIFFGGSKKHIIELNGTMAMRYIKTTVNIKSFKNNQLTYSLNIEPIVEDKKFKDVQVKYMIILFGKTIRNEHEIKRPIKFETEEIKIKEDGTYKGTFTYDLGEDEYTEITEEYKIMIKDSSGIIQ